MQCELQNSVYVDGFILTEVTREQNLYDSAGATYYGLYFTDPEYWLPLEKTICISNLPTTLRIHHVIRKVKEALQPLKELSFACFPYHGSEGSWFRLFVVFTSRGAAALALRLLERYPKDIFPGAIHESNCKILRQEALKEDSPYLQRLADIPVRVGLLGNHVFLRIGSDDPATYRREFMWLLNTDIHYDPNYPDRYNEVSLLLDPASERYRSIGVGIRENMDVQEIDDVAELISSGIKSKLYGTNINLRITFAFHSIGRTGHFRAGLISKSEIKDITYAKKDMELRCDNRTDVHQPLSSESSNRKRERELDVTSSTPKHGYYGWEQRPAETPTKAGNPEAVSRKTTAELPKIIKRQKAEIHMSELHDRKNLTGGVGAKDNHSQYPKQQGQHVRKENSHRRENVGSENSQHQSKGEEKPRDIRFVIPRPASNVIKQEDSAGIFAQERPENKEDSKIPVRPFNTPTGLRNFPTGPHHSNWGTRYSAKRSRRSRKRASLYFPPKPNASS